MKLQNVTAYLAYLVIVLITVVMGMSMAATKQKAEATAKETTDTQLIEVQGGSAETFHVTVKIFPETFRISSEPAQVHFTFEKADNFKTDADSLFISCSIEQITGWGSSTFEFLPLSKILKDGYVWRVNFTGVNVSVRSPVSVSPGIANIKISLSLLKSSPMKLQSSSFGADTMYEPATPKTTIEIPPIPIEIFR